MKMSYFTALLRELAQTCQDLEKIKDEHTKDHERVSRSFEKTLLSILKREQSILNQVEGEHKRLRDCLTSVQKANDLALQNGVSEINNMVHEIFLLSSQLKQILATSADSDPIVNQIQKKVSNIFNRKKSINISLQKVHFIPHPLKAIKLGEIRCEEQSLAFSFPAQRKGGTITDGSSKTSSALLKDESPPWEDLSHSSDDVESVGVKIILGDDSDQDCVSIAQQPGEEKTAAVYEQSVTLSPREQSAKEANRASLSPRTATKIWISDAKHGQSRLSRSSGKREVTVQKVSKEESNKVQNSDFTIGKGHACKSQSEIKSSSMVAKGITKTARSNRSLNTMDVQVQQCQSVGKAMYSPTAPLNNMPFRWTAQDHEYKAPLTKSAYPTQRRALPNTGEINSTKNSGLEMISGEQKIRTYSRDQTDNSEESNNIINGHLTFPKPDQETLFRATAAYVCGDSSDEGLEEIKDEKDSQEYREVAIKESKVPSAKNNGDGEQLSNWMSMASSSYTDDENGNKKSSDRSTHVTGSPRERTTLFADSARTSGELTSEIYNGRMSPRPASPTDSVKSSYTFIIDSPRKKEAAHATHKSRSFFRLSANLAKKDRPVINSPNEPLSKNVSKQQKRFQSVGNLCTLYPQNMAPNSRKKAQMSMDKQCVQRSASMPYIEKVSKQSNSRLQRPLSASERRDSTSSASSCWSNPRSSVNSTPFGSSRVHGRTSHNRIRSARTPRRQIHKMESLSKSEPNLLDCQKVNGDKPKGFIRQFGKFGSGRAELNLPHGICATKTGSLYIVDYGNKRLQIMNTRGKVLQQIALKSKNYFDVAVSNRGLIALTNSTDRTVEIYNKHGRLLQVISKNFGAPRGIATNYQDDFIVADMRLGTICIMTLNSATGCQKESTIIPGFNKPYLVACNSQGLLAITERGLDGGCCVKVLREDWQIVKILGLRECPGPKLFNPWGVCIDSEGGVLVSDWGNQHCVIYYPPKTPAKILVSEGLSSPRGVAVWQDYLLLVADSMHNCIKVFQYQEIDP